MQLTSSSFGHHQRIPGEFAFCVPDRHSTASRPQPQPAPALERRAGGGALAGADLLDSDVPTRADDVNQEGRTVPASLPRARFSTG